MMAEMDGQTALTAIRALENTKGIAAHAAACAIMMTALSDEREVMAAIHGGANAYLTKPIDESKLLAKLSELHLVWGVPK
jgi:two-component system, chemotaxis family, chemotaxis protein CheY